MTKDGIKIFEGDYNNEGEVVVWCETCYSWQFGALDVPTKDICIHCHFCEGNFFFADVIEYFEPIGTIHD
jgi:hypothetical protein